LTIFLHHGEIHNTMGSKLGILKIGLAVTSYNVQNII